MTKRRDDEADNGYFTTQFPAVVADDAFLTDISRGVKTEEGEDDLADLLLGLREEIEAPMPAPPTLADLGLSAVDEEDNGGATVIPMRPRGGFRRGLVSGLIGAAAATLVVAGGGAAVYNAQPGSPLWGVSKSMFGDRAAVVELAGTLEELDGFAETGDVEGLRALLSDARAQLSDDRGGEVLNPNPNPVPVTTTTATVEIEPRSSAPAAPAAPAAPEPQEPTTVTARETIVERETLTETAVQTVTSIVTVFPQVPVNPVPLPTPVIPTAPSDLLPGDEAGVLPEGN
ncbi:hypothetical protein [Corynebacterium sp. A21]|uniref:hypothetical protein n=1 Tax=Corynebacterium sp. A21 TaxID=3457318 RepID=UPI003FD5B24A